MEFIFADQDPQNCVFCGIYFCGSSISIDICGIHFCGSPISLDFCGFFLRIVVKCVISSLYNNKKVI